jgi:hypothetical protein
MVIVSAYGDMRNIRMAMNRGVFDFITRPIEFEDPETTIEPIVGNFGGEQLFDYTAHGDAINTAARFESLNKHFGTRICASAEVAERVPDFQGLPVGWVALKGKSERLKVFEPLDARRGADPVVQSYRDAYRKLEDGDPAAGQAFAALVAQDGGNALASLRGVTAWASSIPEPRSRARRGASSRRGGRRYRALR